MSDGYGARVLPEIYKEWAASGMIANIGGRIIDVGAGKLVLEGNLTAEKHSFPTSRGPIVHGGAIATLTRRWRRSPSPSPKRARPPSPPT